MSIGRTRAFLLIGMMALAMLAFLPAVRCAGDTPRVLTDDSIEELKTGKWFVKLFAPWCGHCKRLAPTWEVLAGSITEGTVATADCTVEKRLAQVFGVRSYPTLRIVDDGIVYEYSGSRSQDVLLEHYESGAYKSSPSKSLASMLAGNAAEAAAKEPVEEQPKDGLVAVSAASTVLTLTDAAFREQIESGEPIFIKFYAPWCGHCQKLAPIWEQLAERLAGKIHVAKVDCTVEKWACAKFGVRGYPTLLLMRGGKFFGFKDADRNLNELEGFALDGYRKTRAATIPSLVMRSGGSKVVDLSESSFDDVALADGATTMVMFYAPWCGHCQKAESAYADFAEEMSGTNIKVARVNGDENKLLLSRFGVRGFPTFKLFVNGEVFDYPGTMERLPNAWKAFAEGGYKDVQPSVAGPRLSTAEMKLQSWALMLAEYLPQYQWMGQFDDWVKNNLATAFFAVCFVSAAIGNVMGFLTSLIVFRILDAIRAPKSVAPRPAAAAKAKPAGEKKKEVPSKEAAKAKPTEDKKTK